MKHLLKSISALLISIFLLAGCKPAETPPTVTTKVATGISSISAISGGTVTDDGGSPVIERGICWGTSPNPTVNHFTANDGSTGMGSFSATISGLTGNTQYYARAYAINDAGLAYGNEISFVTSTISDFAFTLPATDVRFYKATLNGLVNPSGVSTEVYFEYGTTTSYGSTIAASQSPVSQNNSSVSALVMGLDPAITYHFRIKTVSYSGVTFGEDMTFDTNYLVGDTTQGGYVFYVDSTGGHGYVLSLQKVGEYIPWSNGNYVLTSASDTALGMGQTNTNAIILVQGAGNYAAKLCADAVINGYSDWFLPSINELLVARQALPLHNYLESFVWSSTEVDSASALVFDNCSCLYPGGISVIKSATDHQTNNIWVYDPIVTRPVRKF